LRSIAPEAVIILAGVATAGSLAWLAWGTSIGVVTTAVGTAVSSLLVSRRALERAVAFASRADRSFRLEHATATASRSLLKRDVVDPVGTALAALIDGVDTDAVFLETNVLEPPDGQGSTATVRDILFADRSGSGARWELTGWRVGRQAKQALDAGRDYVTGISGLDPAILAYYRAMEIRGEILVPITIEGRWVGSLGFLSLRRERSWAADERRLLRAAAEMIGSYWERRDARAELEDLLANKDEFIAAVSHEVRTPLTAVVGFASELDEHGDEFSEAERADLTSLLAEQSREMANIVDDLLTAARADAGALVVAPEALSVRKLVGDVLSSHPTWVDFAIDEDILVLADPGRARQILRNLLTNADRYGGDTVKIHAHQTSGNTVRLEVRDNGHGIPYQLRSHVFEPYARAKTGSAQPASVGLGLAVARQLARLMGGDVVLSELDGWTVFTLCLPAAAPLPYSVA
jgi:signal transduction histidine kinase